MGYNTIIMRVYIFTKQLEIGYILAEEFHKLGHFTLVFSDTESMFLAMKNTLEQPDLIAADYTIFNHENFNFNETLETENILTPVIYYNEPCITRGNRRLTWMGNIKEKMTVAYKDSRKYEFYSNNLSEYQKLFEVLQQLVESDELSQYIPLMQKPKPLPEDLKKSFLERLKENSFDSLIFTFKKRNKLPQNLYNLLLLFNEHKDEFISAEDLSLIYSDRYKSITATSMKVLISKLKHYIQDDAECIFYIAKNKKGYKLI